MLLLAALLLSPADPPKPAPAGKPVVVTVGPLKNTAPAAWKGEKPANLLRSHQFKLPAKDPALNAAEVAVYHEASPKVDAKFAEWKATITPPDGKTIDDVAKVTKQDLPGKAVAHRLDVTGTWKYRERPRDPKSKEELRAGYRVVWLVVTHADGATHVRLSGPSEVVGEHVKGFDEWVKGLK